MLRDLDRKNDYRLREKMKRQFFLIAFFIFIVILALIYYFSLVSRPKGFSADDPLIVEMISAIHDFQESNGDAPRNLEELEPEFIEQIRLPESVESVEYDSALVNVDSWEISFITACGFEYKYTSEGDGIGRWVSQWGSPENFVECGE